MTSNPVEEIRKTMQNLIVGLVDNPEKLVINIVHGEQTIVFEVRCDSKDRGKIIGKGGEMAKSLRHIITSLAARNKVRAMLEIVD